MLVSVGQPPSEERARALGVQARMVGATSNPAVLAKVAGLIDDGKLKPYVSQILPLCEAREAQEMIGSRHTRGKIVLQVM
jgi:NADPH:quinone reductase-like Zn-dependent oxidoreductase